MVGSHSAPAHRIGAQGSVSTPPMTPIPKDKLPTHRGLVHVQGWPAGCCFRYIKTDPDGTHHIETPKTRKRYTTKNTLTYTKRYEPRP